MKDKKVIHFPKWFPNKFDGQNGVFIQKHIESVQENCHQVVISVYKDSTSQNRIRVYEVEKGPILYVEVEFKPFSFKGFNVIFQIFLGIKYGLKYAKKSDIIHSHIMGRTMLMAWFVSLIKQKPLVHTEHWSLFLQDDLWKSKGSFYHKMTDFLFKRCQHIFAVSPLLKQKLETINSDLKIDILSNVISENTFKDISKRERFTFIHVSDLRDDIKNISDIINAFIEVEQILSKKIELLIVGDGEDREMLETLSKPSPNIHFSGRLNNSEVYQAMNSAHSLILNSRIETFGMVIPEAFACGLPVICAKNGVTDLFVDADSGFVINQSSKFELKDAMLKMVELYSTFDSLKIIEKSKAFSSESVGQTLDKTYKSLINEN